MYREDERMLRGQVLRGRASTSTPIMNLCNTCVEFPMCKRICAWGLYQHRLRSTLVLVGSTRHDEHLKVARNLIKHFSFMGWVSRLHAASLVGISRSIERMKPS